MPSAPTLRVDTGKAASSLVDTGSAIASSSSPRSPSFGTFSRDRARSISQAVLPSFRISSANDNDAGKSNDSGVSSSKASVSHGVDKARNESRKLLAHILSQLQSRPVPPSLLNTLVSTHGLNGRSSGTVIKTVKGAINYTGTLRERRTHQPVPQDDTDSEDETSEGFSTDTTFDLLNQLKDVLVISIAHSWDIFYDSTPQNQRSNSDKLRESFMRRRSLSVGRGSRSRSPSIGRGESEGIVQAPQLLSQCISILASIVSEDCRFKIASFRPLRPPNSLQSIALDIGRFLVHTRRHDPRVISQIAFAMLPAFMTFSSEMHAHLLKFFDDGVLGIVLADLRRVQGTAKPISPTADLSYSDSMSSIEPPMVSIFVDEVKEDSTAATTNESWRRWMQALSPDDAAVRSTSAPLQDVAIYHLSSIIPPLLAAIFDSIDLVIADASTAYRFHLLISRISESKPDTYLDVLAVIAYHTPRARYAAISVLLSYWPHALGHLSVSKPFPTINHHDTVARETKGGMISSRYRSHPYSHQFVPWRIGKAIMPNLFSGFSQYDCHACGGEIEGLALLCPLCMCLVHFNCYDDPDGSFFTQYSIAADPSVQKVAVHRFCHILPQRHAVSPDVVYKQHHAFRPVNLFSLTLCFICKKPLWGPVAQALKCGSCNQFVHSACLTKAGVTDLPGCRSVTIDDTYMTISWESMRESFADYYREVFLTAADLPHKTYEEISVFLAVLWVQLQILLNGLALGSIVVKQNTPAFSDGQLDEFELHYLVELYEAYLSSSTVCMSRTLSDHLVENRLGPSPTHLFFNWNVLTYVASVIKVPASDAEGKSADLLTAKQPGHGSDSLEDDIYPYEVVTLAHLRDQLGDQLNLHSEAAARYFLSHLFHLGFFQRVDSQGNLFEGGPHPERLQCSFLIPMGLEVSTEVETLVVSIEACLSDIDLSVNETGFLFLVRKFWPDGILTEYAQRRLSKAVLGWILSEDDDLAIMLRDYVARGLTLPGVRSGTEVSWPPPTQPRQAATSSTSNGGDYVASRRTLLSRYSARWLLALHDQDIDNYSVMIFDLLIEQAQELPVRDEYFLGKIEESPERREATITEKLLHLILKLSQASVLFTTFDDLFQKWLNRASSLDLDQQTHITSLPKLFNRDFDASQRFTTIADSRLTLTETPTMLTINPLKVIIDIATKSNEGYDSTLHWLCLFVRSGVEISVPTFMQLVQLGNQFGVSLEVCSLLVKAALWSCWIKSMGRQDLQTVIAAIHAGIGPQLVAYLQAHHLVSETLQVIRQSLATCLLLYGCSRSHLQSSGLILESEIQGLPSRRKMSARADTVTDPIIVNSALIDTLKTYVGTGLEEVACIAAKFLDAFMHQASLVEAYEVDNFILRNGPSLCTCMWQFYSVQRPEISQIRTKVLLRILVVDVQPFENLLEDLLALQRSWELRLQAVVRLFRIIQDTTSPTFIVEDRQWRSSVTSVFRFFFGALWEDDREEIRLAVDTWTQTLLAAHFEAIALCWDEALAKSPVSDRIKLVSFLNQLRPHFPHWRLLSWQVILEALLEGEFLQKNGDDEDGPMSAHLSMYGLPSGPRKTMFIDPDLQALQNSLTSLSLRMLAEGIPIELSSLLRLKEHLARTLGFTEVDAVSAAAGNGNSFYVRFSSLDIIPEAAYPCINELTHTLDSAQPYSLVSSAMGGRHLDDEAPAALLVGSIFVDLFLETFIHCDKIESIPALTLKNLLKSLVIVIYKHDFDSRPLKPQQGVLRRAVKRALDLLLLDISYDLRQLVLTVCHAFIKRWPNLIIANFVCDAIESTIGLMEKLNYQQNGDDILIDQTKIFLRTILGLYAFSGAFHLLCKRRRTQEFFAIIKYITGPHVKAEHNPHPHETLRDALLRDTLTRSVEGDDESLQIAIDNINTYVEVVHHTEYSLALMQFVGLCLAGLTRKTADLHHARFDPSPLLLLACTLIQHNKAHSRDLLLYLETLLRSSLNRFDVSTVSLRRVLQVTTTLYRKAAKVAGPNAQDGLVNPLTSAMLEITREALNAKARVTPSTLAALIEALIVQADRGNPGLATFIPLESHVQLAADGLYYLFTGSSPDGLVLSDFIAAQAVARMVMQGAELQRGLLGHVGKNPMSVRVWNILVLAALSRPSGTAAALLFEQFSAFSLAYNTSLNLYHSVQLRDPDIQDRIHADVSSAYASIKLWLLLARKAASNQPDVDTAGHLQDGEAQAAQMVWNELWPSFEIVLTAFEADARAGNSSPLASTMWSSVADLFLFVRQSRSVVALDTVAPANTLNRLKDLVQGESKVTRVARSLKEAPPDDSLEFFVGQLLTEITAEEKLHAAKRQINTQKG